MSNTRNWPAINQHGMTIGGKHTFTDWSMIPLEIPVFAPALPELNYQDVPGASGALDNTSVLTGSVAYKNRTGSFEFIVLPDAEWSEAYSTVLNFLQGKRFNCILDDDPEYFYTGRFWVNQWKSDKGASTIVIEYSVDPYKQSIDTTATHDWLWDDLFDVTIYYGTFNVSGSKTRTFINPSAITVMPTFTCSAVMLVTVNGIPGYILPRGVTTNPGFVLQPGENTLVFTGTGNVLADYAMSKML